MICLRPETSQYTVDVKKEMNYYQIYRSFSRIIAHMHFYSFRNLAELAICELLLYERCAICDFLLGLKYFLYENHLARKIRHKNVVVMLHILNFYFLTRKKQTKNWKKVIWNVLHTCGKRCWWVLQWIKMSELSNDSTILKKDQETYPTCFEFRSNSEYILSDAVCNLVYLLPLLRNLEE